MFDLIKDYLISNHPCCCGLSGKRTIHIWQSETWKVCIDFGERYIVLANRTGNIIQLEYANPEFFEQLDNTITKFMLGQNEC